MSESDPDIIVESLAPQSTDSCPPSLPCTLNTWPCLWSKLHWLFYNLLILHNSGCLLLLLNTNIGPNYILFYPKNNGWDQICGRNVLWITYTQASNVYNREKYLSIHNLNWGYFWRFNWRLGTITIARPHANSITWFCNQKANC